MESVPTALVVEDDPQWLGIIRDELLRAGFKIDWATEREEALRKLAEPPFGYDVVFLDPNLDENLGGLSGRAVAERLAARNPASNMVLVSGFASPDDLRNEYAELAITLHGVFEKRSFDLSRFRRLLFDLRGVDSPAEALFKCDRAALAKDWERVRAATANAEKGEALEALAISLLSGISLLEFYDRRVRTRTGEIDAAFTVTATPGTLCQEWGGLLLVECRNRQEKLDAGAVGKFARSLRERHAKVGIVFSMAGLTGADGRNARGVLANEYLTERRVIIVLDEDDIDAVIAEGRNLYALLRERDTALRLGR